MTSSDDERYFYHSFPRGGSSQCALAILDCIARYGLVLAPEVRYLSEPQKDGGSGPPIQMIQKRICFTELSPKELTRHSETFGPFALEWDIETLRAMGAMPVFYVPMSARPDTLEGIGSALLARLTEIQALLTRLESLSSAVSASQDPQERLQLTLNGNVAGTTNITVAAARELIQLLQHGHQPIEILRNAVQGLAGYFYPVDDPQYTTTLGYYRQREWRIVANMVHMDQPISTPSDPDFQTRLIEINPQYWTKRLQFHTGEFSRAEQSQLYPLFAGKPVIESARRVVAPRAVLGEVQRIMKSTGSEIPTVALEDL